MHVTKRTEHEISKDISMWKGDPEPLVRSVILSKEKDKYHLLRGIALYENTYFNSQQIKEFINELKEFSKELGQEGRTEIESLIKFAETIELGDFLYFSGV